VESFTEVDDIKESEKGQPMNLELRKLQFYGAGPKTALPDVLESGNNAAYGNNKESADC